jgi:hypothetical protein
VTLEVPVLKILLADILNFFLHTCFSFCFPIEENLVRALQELDHILNFYED